MKRKLIAAAIAAALCSPGLALADSENVIIYGKANLSIDRVSSSGALGTSTTQVSSNASHFGIKGSEELGDGWTATWQVEQMVNYDNAGNGTTLATRNTFINLLNSDYGVFILGRHDTPYKLASRTMDVFFDTIADNRSLMGGASLDLTNLSGSSAAASFDGRQGDVIAYIAPAIGDLMLSGAYVAGAETATGGQVKGDAWSFTGLYTSGPVNVNFGYEIHNLGSAGSGTIAVPAPLAAVANHSERAYKLAGSYAFDKTTVYGVYERTRDNFGTVLSPATGSDFFGHKTYYFAAKHRIDDKHMFKVAYTRAGSVASSSNSGAKQWSMGLDRKITRRTSIYALYTRLTNDSGASFGLVSPDGSTGGIDAAGAGSRLSAVSAGIVHKF